MGPGSSPDLVGIEGRPREKRGILCRDSVPESVCVLSQDQMWVSLPLGQAEREAEAEPGT